MACAAACTSAPSASVAGVPGFMNTPTVVAFGTSCRSSSSRLAPARREKHHAGHVAAGTVEACDQAVSDRIARRSRTRSASSLSRPWRRGPPRVLATMTATGRRNQSAASAGSRSERLSAQRSSIATLRPSTKPGLLQALAKRRPGVAPRLAATCRCRNSRPPASPAARAPRAAKRNRRRRRCPPISRERIIGAVCSLMRPIPRRVVGKPRGLLQRAARQHGGEMLAVVGRGVNVRHRLDRAAAFAGLGEQLARRRLAGDRPARPRWRAPARPRRRRRSPRRA